MKKRILLVEDDDSIAEIVQIALERIGLEVERVGDGAIGLDICLTEKHSAIILDVMLPQLDGIEICRTLRAKGIHTPVLMLTSRSEEADRIIGLELGADDYVTKPFSVRELEARVKALLRRSSQDSIDIKQQNTITIGSLTINIPKQTVLLSDKQLELTALEFKLLAFLAANPGVIYNRETLLKEVWGYATGTMDHIVNTTINRLRSKIEPDPTSPIFIQTVRGAGYRIAEQ